MLDYLLFCHLQGHLHFGSRPTYLQEFSICLEVKLCCSICKNDASNNLHISLKTVNWRHIEEVVWNKINRYSFLQSTLPRFRTISEKLQLIPFTDLCLLLAQNVFYLGLACLWGTRKVTWRNMRRIRWIRRLGLHLNAFQVSKYRHTKGIITIFVPDFFITKSPIRSFCG